jgi:magnesium-transporting ATPase (P-type)
MEPGLETKQRQHAFFAQVERRAQLQYLGLVGLEDQLQPLVPEAIQDCLRAGIKVWMITGDKLETARNIGLACNLIDADMQTTFRPEYSLAECIESFQNCRLVEVTGSWASLAANDEELEKTFALFDTNGDGFINHGELAHLLGLLKSPVKEAAIAEAMDGRAGVDQEGFKRLMRSGSPSMLEAVKFDLKQGWDTYEKFQDDPLYPISMIINREAFLVLFPELAEDAHAADVKDRAGRAELEELRASFFALADKSKSVVFAKAQPSMKKKMVTEIIKRVPGAVTLAVGDGANDVDMIQAAHIGVGISGVEVAGAVNAADYAVGTFRMLHTLLFVHGYWCTFFCSCCCCPFCPCPGCNCSCCLRSVPAIFNFVSIPINLGLIGV